MATTTRRATLDDIPLLIDMMQAFYVESAYPLDRRWAAGSFSALLRDESLGAAWILFRDGEPAGYVVLTVRFSMEHGGLDAFIDDLFVQPGCRRQGVGSELLEALLAECRRRRVLAVHVAVGRDNTAAKALYGRFGLRDNGRQTLTARLTHDPADA